MKFKIGDTVKLINTKNLNILSLSRTYYENSLGIVENVWPSDKAIDVRLIDLGVVDTLYAYRFSLFEATGFERILLGVDNNEV